MYIVYQIKYTISCKIFLKIKSLSGTNGCPWDINFFHIFIFIIHDKIKSALINDLLRGNCCLRVIWACNIDQKPFLGFFFNLIKDDIYPSRAPDWILGLTVGDGIIFF